MRKLFLIASALWVLFISSSVYAVRVTTLYQAEIPVSSQSAQEKTHAIQDGLVRVLIKVSGNKQILEKYPALKASLSQADSLVQEYKYTSITGAAKSESNLLSLHFDPDGVNRLLREAGAPIWEANRPLILVWLAYQGLNHPVDIVDSAKGLIQTQLKQSTGQRGLAVILPMMDMQDINTVTVNDVINKSLPTLQQAAARYDSNAMLVGHLSQNNIDIESEWTLVLGADKWEWDVRGKSLQEVLNGLANNIADTLASRYATVVTDAVQTQLSLKVAGVKQQNDLLQLIKYLQHLTSVADVQLASVAGSDVVLNVNLRGSKQAFIQVLAMGKKLIPAQDTPSDGMAYQWMHEE
jgi:uncharacterized protein